MKKPSAEMKEYLIVTAHPALPAHMKGPGKSFDDVRRLMSLGEAWKKSAHRNKLVMLSREIQMQVVDRHGGQIINDGSGYGIEGNPNQFNDMLCVRTTAAGLKALKKIDDVGRISETIDFNNLQKQPDGVSNVPPGVCWSLKHP
ncbi:MAG: hypothetical protein EPN97_12715 [Alphaproteobacteria bacterium]|nr:MAG: hypothetical protein EPN97_12715 [Alphaproteobacteria bacterium]